ncbi:TRAP transporter substrate-binding protein [Chelativorans sp. Marseille-P2723]|uniref:TRAP transporter substrate-binding protein n=1 Tax=Chelativorans sp. Marseille-P2723 TaxID=2709133 RepID=UPI00156DC253|nr:TRAP transporter substrate-binding protein [Chelativorans sp. Marseille-P2723]
MRNRNIISKIQERMERRDVLKLFGAAGAATLVNSGMSKPTKAQGGKVTIRVATVQQNTQEPYLVLRRWGDEVEARSGGDITVLVSGTEAVTGGERDALEGVRALGVYDACSITSSLLSTVEPRYGISDLPFIFKDRETAFKYHDGEIGAKLDAMLLQTSGLRPLMHTYSLMRHTHLRSTSIRSLADFEGLKIRSVQADIPLRMFAALGANAVPMAATEVYTSIQTGAIDGWECPLDAALAWKTYEVAKHTSLTGHQYADVVLCISEAFFQKLSDEHQAILVDTANDLLADHRERMGALDKAAIAELEGHGATVTEIDDKAPFQEAVASIYEDLGSRLGILDIIEEVRAL